MISLGERPKGAWHPVNWLGPFSTGGGGGGWRAVFIKSPYENSVENFYKMPSRPPPPPPVAWGGGHCCEPSPSKSSTILVAASVLGSWSPVAASPLPGLPASRLLDADVHAAASGLSRNPRTIR